MAWRVLRLPSLTDQIFTPRPAQGILDRRPVLRREELEQRALEEFGVASDTLVVEYGPDQPVPPSAASLSWIAISATMPSETN